MLRTFSLEVPWKMRFLLYVLHRGWYSLKRCANSSSTMLSRLWPLGDLTHVRYFGSLIQLSPSPLV